MDEDEDKLYEFSSRPSPLGTKSTNVAIKFQVVTRSNPCAASECISVSSTAYLTAIRRQISDALRPHFEKGFIFLKRSKEVQHTSEHSLTLFDILPKVPFERKPAKHFQFPDVRYKRLPFEYDGKRYMVECACLVFLCERSAVSHWGKDELQHELSASEVHGFSFIPLDIVSWKQTLTDYRLSRLHECAAIGDEDELSFLMAQIHDECHIEKLRDHKLATPLHYAAENGHVGVCNMLLANMGQEMLYSKDARKRTPLHCALRRKRFKTIRLLIKWQPDIFAIDDESVSGGDILNFSFSDSDIDNVYRGLNLKNVSQDVLYIFLVRALEKRDLRATKNVLKYTTIIEHREGFGRSVLHLAAEFAPVTVIESLIALQCEITEKDELGYFPFHIACREGHLEILDKLYFEAMTDFEVEFAIQIALRKNHFFCVKRIGELRENIKMRDETLQWIVNLMETKSRKTFSCLLPCVASRKKLLSRFTLTACQANKSSVVELLLENGADINFQDLRGRSILHEAAIKGKNNIIDCILQNGANCLLQDWRGATPLHYACSYGRLESVKAIVSHDTNSASIQDIAGRTPFLCALQNKQRAVCEYLLLTHIDSINVTVSDRAGRNALHYSKILSKVLLQKILGVFTQKDVSLSAGSPPDIQNTDLFLLPSDCKFWACRSADNYHGLSIVNELTLEDVVAETNCLQPQRDRKGIFSLEGFCGDWYSGKNRVESGFLVKRFIPSAKYLAGNKISLSPFQHHRFIVESETDKNEDRRRKKTTTPKLVYRQCPKCTKLFRSSRHSCWAGYNDEDVTTSDVFVRKEISPFEWIAHTELSANQHPVFNMLTEKTQHILETFISQDEKCLTEKDWFNRTIFEVSVDKVQPVIVKKILPLVKDVQLLDKLLHRAIKVQTWNDEERKHRNTIVGDILKAKANPSYQLEGFTPLELACNLTNTATVELLLSYGACPFVGCSLHITTYKGNIGVLKLLLSHKCDTNNPQCSTGSEEKRRVASIRSGILQCAALSKKLKPRTFELLKENIPDLFKSKKLLTSKLVKKTGILSKVVDKGVNIDMGPPLVCLIKNSSFLKMIYPSDSNRKNFEDIASFLIKAKSHQGEVRVTKKGHSHLECICFKEAMYGGHGIIARDVFQTSYKTIINCLSSDSPCKAWENIVDKNINTDALSVVKDERFTEPLFDVSRRNMSLSALVDPIIEAYEYFYKKSEKSDAQTVTDSSRLTSGDDKETPDSEFDLYEDLRLLIQQVESDTRQKIIVIIRLLSLLATYGDEATYFKTIQEAPVLFRFKTSECKHHLQKAKNFGILTPLQKMCLACQHECRYGWFNGRISLLEVACREGEVNMIHQMINAPIPPDVNDRVRSGRNFGWRFIDLVSYWGHLTAFKKLVNSGAKPDLLTVLVCCKGGIEGPPRKLTQDLPPIYTGVWSDVNKMKNTNTGSPKNRSDIVRMTVGRFLDINEQHKEYGTPLHLAIEAKMWSVVDEMVDRGADPLLKHNKVTCLEALLCDDSSPTETCIKYIEHCQEHLVYSKKKFVSSLIRLSARRSKGASLEALLSLLQERFAYKAMKKIVTKKVKRRLFNLELTRDISKHNVLHWIVKNGHSDAFQLLIDMLKLQDIQELDQHDSFGCNPLWYSIECQRHNFTQTLLFLGFNTHFERAIPNFETRKTYKAAVTTKTMKSVRTYTYPSGDSTLSCGVGSLINPACKYFSSKSSKSIRNIEIKDRKLQVSLPPLFKKKKHTKHLMSISNFAFTNKTTYLHAAAAFGETNLVKEMVENKFMDINKVDSHSMTALHYSLLNGHVECSKFCLQHTKVSTENEYALGCIGFHILQSNFQRYQKWVELALQPRTYDLLPDDYKKAVDNVRCLFDKLYKLTVITKYKSQNNEAVYGLLRNIIQNASLTKESAFILGLFATEKVCQMLVKLTPVLKNHEFLNAVMVFMATETSTPDRTNCFSILSKVKNITIDLSTFALLYNLRKHDIYAEVAMSTTVDTDVLSNALFISCRNGKQEHTYSLLTRLKASMRQKDTYGSVVNKALIISLLNKQFDGAIVCLENGADGFAEVPTRDIKHFLITKHDSIVTPLQVCAMVKNAGVILVILRGVCLETAGTSLNEKILRQCLDSMKTAARVGNMDIFKLIEDTLISKLKYSLSSAELTTLLMTSVQFSQSGVASILVEKQGLDYLQRDGDKTVMHIAALAGLTEIVRTLKQKCPQLVNLKDKQGLLPVDYAQSFGHIDVTDLLSPNDTELSDIFQNRHVGGFRNLMNGNINLSTPEQDLHPQYNKGTGLATENILRTGNDEATLLYLNSFYPKHSEVSDDNLMKWITICCQLSYQRTLKSLCERLPNSDFLRFKALVSSVSLKNADSFHFVSDLLSFSWSDLSASDHIYMSLETILERAILKKSLDIFKYIWAKSPDQMKQTLGIKLLTTSVGISNFEIRNFLLGEVGLPDDAHMNHTTLDSDCPLCLMDCCFGWANHYLSGSKIQPIPVYRNVNSLEHYKKDGIDKWPLSEPPKRPFIVDRERRNSNRFNSYGSGNILKHDTLDWLISNQSINELALNHLMNSMVFESVDRFAIKLILRYSRKQAVRVALECRRQAPALRLLKLFFRDGGAMDEDTATFFLEYATANFCDEVLDYLFTSHSSVIKVILQNNFTPDEKQISYRSVVCEGIPFSVLDAALGAGSYTCAEYMLKKYAKYNLEASFPLLSGAAKEMGFPPKISWFIGVNTLGDRAWVDSLTETTDRMNLADVWLTASENQVLVKKVEAMAHTSNMIPGLLKGTNVHVDKKGFSRQSCLKTNSDTWLNAFICSHLVLGRVYDVLFPEEGRTAFDTKSIQVWCLPESSTEDPKWVHSPGHDLEAEVKILNLNNNKESAIVVHDDKLCLNMMEYRLKREVKEIVVPQIEKMIADMLPGVQMKVSVNWASVDERRNSPDYTTILRTLRGDMFGSPLAGLFDILERCRFLIENIEELCCRSVREELVSVFKSFGDIVVEYTKPRKRGSSHHESRWLFFIENGTVIKNKRDFGPLFFLEFYRKLSLLATTALCDFVENLVAKGVVFVSKYQQSYESLEIPMKSVLDVMKDSSKINLCEEITSSMLYHVHASYKCLSWTGQMNKLKCVRLNFVNHVLTDGFQIKDDKLLVKIPLVKDPDFELIFDPCVVAIGEELVQKASFPEVSKIDDLAYIDFDYYCKVKKQNITTFGGKPFPRETCLPFGEFILEVAKCPNMAAWRLQQNIKVPAGLWCPARYQDVTNGKMVKYLIVRMCSVHHHSLPDSPTSAADLHFKVIEKHEVEELPLDKCCGLWYYVSFEDFADSDRQSEESVHLLSYEHCLYRWINPYPVLEFFKGRNIYLIPRNGFMNTELIVESKQDNPNITPKPLIPRTSKQESLLTLDAKLFQVASELCVDLVVDWHDFETAGKLLKMKNLPYKAASALLASAEKLQSDFREKLASARVGYYPKLYFRSSQITVKHNACATYGKYTECLRNTIAKLNSIHFKSSNAALKSEIGPASTLVKGSVLGEPVEIATMSEKDLSVFVSCEKSGTELKPFTKSMELALIKCFISNEGERWTSMLSCLLGRLSVNVTIELPLFGKQQRSHVVMQYLECRDAFLESFVNFCLTIPEGRTRLADELLNITVKLDNKELSRSNYKMGKSVGTVSEVSFKNGTMVVNCTPHNDVKAYTSALYQCFAAESPRVETGVTFELDDITLTESGENIRIVLHTSNTNSTNGMNDIARLLKNNLVLSVVPDLTDQPVSGKVVHSEVLSTDRLAVKWQVNSHIVRRIKSIDVTVFGFGKRIPPALHRLSKGLTQTGCYTGGNAFDLDIEANGTFTMIVNHYCSLALKFSADKELFPRGVREEKHQFHGAQIAFFVGENPVPVPVRLDKCYTLACQLEHPTYDSKKTTKQYVFLYKCRAAAREVRLFACCMKCSSFLPVRTPFMTVPAGKCVVVNRNIT